MLQFSLLLKIETRMCCNKLIFIDFFFYIIACLFLFLFLQWIYKNVAKMGQQVLNLYTRTYLRILKLQYAKSYVIRLIPGIYLLEMFAKS